jgi:hypothetical protein
MTLKSVSGVTKLWIASRVQLLWAVIAARGKKSISQYICYKWIKYKN